MLMTVTVIMMSALDSDVPMDLPRTPGFLTLNSVPSFHIWYNISSISSGWKPRKIRRSIMAGV